MDRTIRTSTLLVCCLVAGCGKAPTPARRAPDFVVETVEAPITKVKLSDLKGKVVIVDFWATWCAPCKESMPEVDRIYKKYKDRGLVVLAVGSEPRATLRAFIPKSGVSYPFHVEPNFEGSRAFDVQAIPRIIVVDRQGMVVLDEEGLTDGKALEAAVEKAL